jgi:hypothetical protein
MLLSRQAGKTIAHREVGLNSGETGAGGTSIAPAPCGCGARGAVSGVVQSRPNCS